MRGTTLWAAMSMWRMGVVRSSALVGWLLFMARLRISRIDSDYGEIRLILALAVWNFHLGIAAGCTCVDGGGDLLQVFAYIRPLLIAQNYQRDPSVAEVLLVTNVLVGTEKDLVAGISASLISSPFSSWCQPICRAKWTS